MESISLNKYIKLIANKWKIIATYLVVMLLLFIAFALFMYSPKYKSKATILIKNTARQNFVTRLGDENQFTSISNTSNPIFSQMEILKSQDIAEKVWEQIKDNPLLTKYSGLKKEVIAEVLKGSLKLENPPATDIIELYFVWDDPEVSKLVLKTYLQAYLEFHSSKNKESIVQIKAYIDNQLQESTEELKIVREEIKDYRKSKQSVSIEQEASSIIIQISKIEDEISQLNSELKSEIAKSKSISDNLAIDINQAISFIALGQNESLVTLNHSLQNAQQEFARLSARYQPTNPQLKSLNEEIKEIKAQIEAQVKLVLGKTIAEDSSSVITDPVRTEMVNELVRSQTNISAIQSKMGSLEQTLSDLKEKQSVIPDKQNILKTLLQKENTLSTIVDTLSSKLVEAQIKESEIIDNIQIVQNPNSPINPAFPRVFHIFILFEFIGAILGVATVLGLYIAEDTCNGASEIEEILESPVLGTIPWLTESSYKNHNIDYNPDSVVNIAYQKIMTTLKIKCMKKGMNAISFSSAEFEKRRSVISVNVAKSIAKCGESVVLVDADFREGSIDKEFNLNIDQYPDLTEVLMKLYDYIKITGIHNIEQAVVDKIIVNSLIPVPNNPHMFFISNKNIIDNPYEILTSEAFPILVKRLKEKFKFMIVDTPPILAVPDSTTVSQYLDGLTLISGAKTSRSNLRKVKKICSDNYVEIIGTIARDSLSEVEVPENQYIKQLSSSDSDEKENSSVLEEAKPQKLN